MAHMACATRALAFPGACTSLRSPACATRPRPCGSRRRLAPVRAAAAPEAPEVPATAPAPASVPWYLRPSPENVQHISTVQELVDALAEHREQLVITEYFAPWCAACRSLYPKICKLAEQNPDVVFLCINFDEARQLCRGLNVMVLPYFHFYRGAEGRVASFSASVSKVGMLREMIAQHNTPRCSLPFPTVLDEFPEVIAGGGNGNSHGGEAGGFSGSVEGLPSSSGSDCDFCGPPHGVA